MQCTSIVNYNECITPDNWGFSNITRPFNILYYVLGGSAYYRIDGEEHRFERDHLYILPSNKVFSLREDKRDKFYSVYVHAFLSPELEDLLDIDVSSDRFLYDVLLMIRAYVKENDSVYVRKLVELLVSYISEKLLEKNAPMHVKIKDAIDGDYIRVFKNSDLSDRFNYSNSHIVKIFKSEYNITPKQYAKQLMLKEIVALLNRGESVSDIARMLDFSSPENLSRFFKGCYGYSPQEFKRRFKNFPD